MSKAYKQTSLWKALSIVASESSPRRLLQEDAGVLAPVWFGRDPDSPWHITANLLRLLVGIPLAPIYIIWCYIAAPWKNAVKSLPVLWKIEWANIPDAILLEAPGVGARGEKGNIGGEYAVTGNKPQWLLEVHFKGTTIASKYQVRYDGGHPDESALSPAGLALRKSIQESGYTAISYSMASAKILFDETKRSLDSKSETTKKPGRTYSLLNRQLISHIVLECYAEARATVPGKGDGIEYIWFDEFCLSDAHLSEEVDEFEVDGQRGREVGQLADIFRSAKRVVVLCHIPRCDHTGVDCPWGNRLFTMGEIMYTPEVLQLIRRPDLSLKGGLVSSITVLSGAEFRGYMQTKAAQEKKWHLYNIMQHSTNSGSITWQSAIHSLVVEAIRRDEADGFHLHNMLGKALNGLLPSWKIWKARMAALASVCRVADPWVREYRWWGKPIEPGEGRERLEPLATAIPTKFRDEETDTLHPVLSVIGPKSVKLRHMLRRDDSALQRNPDMRSLKIYTSIMFPVLAVVDLVVLFSGHMEVGLLMMYFTCVLFTTVDFLVGTIYIKRDGWIVYEDHLFPGHNPIPFLQSRDKLTYRKTHEWGPRQLIPRWDENSQIMLHKLALDTTQRASPHPYSVTLVDLQTGVFTKAVVTSKPNHMIVLAVHGSGITCMLVDREERALEATTSVKVGMANVPPFVLSRAEQSGTVYVAGDTLSKTPSERPSRKMPLTYFWNHIFRSTNQRSFA
ncbi:hypothetical protein AN958_05711 [Leucoagaricus sp. SymC.cos]|nr:hypothetical protein AN958_05711 [Leucoagaricus sp. SymC.cos]